VSRLLDEEEQSVWESADSGAPFSFVHDCVMQRNFGYTVDGFRNRVCKLLRQLGLMLW
jgi:hypothetical protein